MFTSADPELEIYVALMIAAGASLAIGLFVRLLTDPRLAVGAKKAGERTGLLRAAYTRKTSGPPRPKLKGGAKLARASAVTRAAEAADQAPVKSSRMRMAIKIIAAIAVSIGLFFIHPSLVIIMPLILFSIRDRKASAVPRGLDGQPLVTEKTVAPVASTTATATSAAAVKAPPASKKKLSSRDQADLDMLAETQKPGGGSFVIVLLIGLTIAAVVVIAVLN